LIQADARTLYSISSPSGRRLVVRHYQAPEKKGQAPEITQQEIEMDSRLAGNVAVQGKSLLVPLSNGELARYDLPLKASAMPEQGRARWRSRQGLADARCQVAVVDERTVLTTDGHKGITYWHWPRGAQPVRKPNPMNRDPLGATTELPERVVGTPVVLPKANAMAELQVVIADHRGVLSLLKGDTLTQSGTGWVLPGRVTSGLFLRGDRVGCVVEHSRLIWLDPSREKDAFWEYQSPGEEIKDKPRERYPSPRIVGQPRQIDDLILVCDESGRFVGLDPKTGKPLGDGYVLKAVVAPAAPPVSFGKGRAFAPLTDGTIMLLSLDRLRDGPSK
jgi:hypothetical protein